MRLLKRVTLTAALLAAVIILTGVTAYAAGDMWDLASTLIKDVYSKILGISTVLAALMSSVAVVGAKLAGNQQKSDKSWDWLKRIWVAWAIINGIGGFVTFIKPFFDGYSEISYLSQLYFLL